MIGDDEWLFCLASITQTKCNHHHPTINTHHSPSYKHFINTQQLTPITQQLTLITHHPINTSSTPNTHHPTICNHQHPTLNTLHPSQSNSLPQPRTLNVEWQLLNTEQMPYISVLPDSEHVSLQAIVWRISASYANMLTAMVPRFT